MHSPARLATALAAVSLTLLSPRAAEAESFEPGSLIIPMDTTYQDWGMLEAYGLVYELLRNDVPIQWVIRQDKDFGQQDFAASAIDIQSNDAIVDHGYRGGPFVIDVADADLALPIIEAWQADNPDTVVHETTSGFEGDVSLTLVVAPTISMFADGNQKIAREYMQAAKIPDSVGDLGWPDDSPDMLDPDEVMGPTEDNHSDGALFDEDGDPVYCQLMSMHWGIGDAEDNPEVVAEVRAYLQHPTHFFAECQAVNAYENNVNGKFLTPNGFLIGDKPDDWDFYNAHQPFGQMDGLFESVGGSEPAYTLPDGDSYKEDDIVMITEKDTPVGVNDVWMTGLIDGLCPGSHGQGDDAEAGGPNDAHNCLSAGKVSYLGGHAYKTDLPISENPDTLGTRLFLNSLFEAPCATAAGHPLLAVEKSGPAQTVDADVTYTIAYSNNGATPALNATLSDTLPAGSSFVSATQDGMLMGDVVTWSLGNLGAGESGEVQLTVTLPEFGEYENVATLDYDVGLNDFELDSNAVMTVYADMFETTSDSDTNGSDTGTTGDGTDTDATSGDTNSTTAGTASGTGDSNSGTGPGNSGSDSGSNSDSATATDSGDTAGASDSRGDSGGGADTDSDGDGDGSGCGCRTGDRSPAIWALWLTPLLLRRRRAA